MTSYDESIAEGYAQWRILHPELLDALLARGAVQADSCVLEVGCGSGNYIRALCERTGCSRWGLDASQAMLPMREGTVRAAFAGFAHRVVRRAVRLDLLRRCCPPP
ncbi:MAG: class I SAM-dependent methyltransferase [Chthoniobacterales bacterium]